MEPAAQAALLAATPLEGVVFGILSLPVCIWVAYTDLSTMKIKNEAVLVLFGIFVVAGLFVLPTYTEYLWRYLHMIVVLVIGFLMTALRMMGGGDAKFAAAMAPFVALSDVTEVLIIFSGLLIVTYVLHRVIRMIPAIRNLAPNWKSWHEKTKFPMGVTLAATQMTYLGLVALQQ